MIDLEFSFSIEEIKRGSTPIFIPFKNLFIISKDLKYSKNIEIIKIIINDGSTRPKVDMSAPFKPRILYPIKVEQFTEIGPGVHSEIESISISSSSVMNLYLVQISLSIMGIIEYPPPNVNNPILKNVLKRMVR